MPLSADATSLQVRHGPEALAKTALAGVKLCGPWAQDVEVEKKDISLVVHMNFMLFYPCPGLGVAILASAGVCSGVYLCLPHSRLLPDYE